MGEMITIPLAEYRRLQAVQEELKDLQAFDRVTGDLDAGREETVPVEFVRRIVEGATPLLVWREHRGLSQSALAQLSGVNRVQIIDIESGRKTGSVATIRKLADALGVAIDDLV